MSIPKSFEQANDFYQKSVDLSLNWLGRYYPQNDSSINGVKLKKIQAFSQHYFFSCLLENRYIEDIWVQYPQPTDKLENKKKLFKVTRPLFRIKYLLWIIFSKQQKLVHLKAEKVDIIFLSSGRHLEDQLPLVKYLNSKFRVLVIGKISKKLQESLRKSSINFINLENGTQLLSPMQKLRNIAFFTLRSWQIKKGNKQSFSANKFLDTKAWRERLWYLKLIQFPEIKATLDFARRLFLVKKPFLVITTSSNDTFNASFCSTAQKVGIKVAELDHGFTAWAIDNAFLSIDWKLGWGKVLASIEPSIEKVTYPVGCPYLIKPTIKSSIIVNRQKLRVLVLWTPPFGSLSLFQSFPSKKTLEFLIEGLCKLPKDWIITIRSHVSYDINSDLKDVKVQNNIKIFNKEPLDKALANSDLVITQQTTAGFIAILHRKPLLFFDNSWLNLEFGHPFVSSKSAIEVPIDQLNNVNGYILKLMGNKSLLEKQRLNQEKFIKDYCAYFGKDSCREIEKFVDTVISKRDIST